MTLLHSVERDYEEEDYRRCYVRRDIYIRTTSGSTWNWSHLVSFLKDLEGWDLSPHSSLFDNGRRGKLDGLFRKKMKEFLSKRKDKKRKNEFPPSSSLSFVYGIHRLDFAFKDTKSRTPNKICRYVVFISLLLR